MPPLPADSIHARACKLKCEKILTRPRKGNGILPPAEKMDSLFQVCVGRGIPGKSINDLPGNSNKCSI